MIAFGLASVGLSAFADVTLNGAELITSSQTISDKVTGSGYFVVANGARLTLSNAENDFTGGVIVSNGFLRAEASNAFGTGPISLESDATDRTVELNVSYGEFHNDLTLKDATTGDHPAIYLYKTAKWYGKLMMDPEMAAEKKSNVQLTVKLETSMLLYLYGDVDVSVSRIRFAGGGEAALYGKIVAGSVLLGNTWSDCGRVSIHNPENQIKELQLWRFTVNCSATNVLRDARLYMRYNGGWGDSATCFFRPCGYDQEISEIYADCSKFGANTYGYQIEGQSDKPATLTLNGKYYEGKSAYIPAYVRISGKINIVIEDKRKDTLNDWFAQSFRGRSSGMEGSLIVKKNGMLRIVDNATFLNVTNIVVSDKASFTCENVKTVAFGDNLRQITVEGSGFIRCESKSTTPICSKRARLDIVSAEPLKQLRFTSTVSNTVQKLFIGGERKFNGLYTCDNLAQMLYNDSNPRYYLGSLTVLRGPGLGFIVR